ncbi:MAG: aminoglycoside phosphotransferase family protein [Pyrinomonadaceae bacterium]
MNKNFTANLPERFTQNTLGVCGKKGGEWLKDLPRIIEEIEETWSLKAEKHFPNLSYNYVAPCVCEGGGAAVLKIALPEENPEIFNEAGFLRLSDGKGAVKLLKFDEKRRAMLLEKLVPGKNLKECFRANEQKAVGTAINVMRKIRRKPPKDSAFRQLEDWFGGFQRAENTMFDKRFASKARNFFEELNSDSKQTLLIHGDLHHENILSAKREPFLIIDPKGIIGNIGYEIGVFLNNHALWLSNEPNLRKKLSETVIQFSKAFDIEPKNLCKWAFAQMVLSAWWTFEENGQDWRNELVRAEIWEEINI